ncbi:MAG: aromatic aminobenezylarsenical efflux permease ArsG family transporter [Bacteroidales bacterium]
MEYLQNLIGNSQFPLITAFLLGLLTAISPCPLAMNITAVGYIGKDLQNRQRVFLNGLLYTLGRIISYSILGMILILVLRQGTSTFKIQKMISIYGEMFIGPLLLVIGIFMLDVVKINLPFSNQWISRIAEKEGSLNFYRVILLGVIFALAFCPYSAVLYFGGLIPLSVSASGAYFLPIVFALATGLPVIIFAWILAFSVSRVGLFYNNIKTFERWFKRITAVIFILVGSHYCWTIFIK